MAFFESAVLSGYGHDQDGPFVSVDDRSVRPWKRARWRPVGTGFGLKALPTPFCTGRHDLASGRSQPCPNRQALPTSEFDQCLECKRATGFNPAFYHAAEVSPQQQAYNTAPHLVYLTHFGHGLMKVGITHQRRGERRLLEQGARLGVFLKLADTAEEARELEAFIAAQFDVAETVRASRKRKLLGCTFELGAAQAEMRQRVEQLRELRSEIDAAPPLLCFDGRYGQPGLWELSPADLSEPDPSGLVSISGDCIGMIGDILVVRGRGPQRGEHFMCSVGALCGRAIQVQEQVTPNRVQGQMSLLF